MNKSIEVQKKQEVALSEGSERVRDQRVYAPRADIFETGEEVVLITDMPGVNEKNVDITLEKNILNINGLVEVTPPEGCHPVYLEYETGDYERSFILSNVIDREKIEANIKDGVLYLKMHKVSPAVTRKIQVKAE